MNKILVDTSAWVPYFRNKTSTPSRMVRRLLADENAMVNGVVLAELLVGARDLKNMSTIKMLMIEIPYLHVTEQIWWKTGDYSYHMRKRGFTAGLADTLIAATAIHYDVELFSLDEHFSEIAEFIPLKLFKP